MKPRPLVACALALLIAVSAVPAPPARAIPVFDAANYAQAVADHIKRIFEIAQRAIMIANQIQELDFWLVTLLKMEELPYRIEILEFLELQAELLNEFDDLRGQYQAISHSLRNVTREFDLTFPGWRAFSDLAAGAVLTVRTEAGPYHFGSPTEYARYQSGRTLQAVRQSLAVMAEDQKNLIQSQLHLQELKEVASQVEGHQQTLELQTSFAALSAEQLIALRQTQEALAMTVGALGAHRLNSHMQLAASQGAAADVLHDQLVEEFGDLVPEHTGENGIDPYPWWVGFRGPGR